jgi:uncharacterized protein (DUF342 family)
MATKEQLEIEQRYNRLLEEQEKKKETLKKLDMDTSAVDKQIKAYKDMLTESSDSFRANRNPRRYHRSVWRKMENRHCRFFY